MKTLMKRGSTLLLQIVIILIGMAMLAFLLAEPHFEGVNAHATFFEVYLDPFIAYVYIASIAFFVALYQAFILLGYIAKNRVFSLPAVRALRMIKYSALALVGFVLGAQAHAFLFVRGKDDIAGGVMLGLLIMIGSMIIAAAAAVFEQVLQNAVRLKSENELTV